jgi:hypothetical protein
VTVKRRVAKLEGWLSPTAATLLWLEEAHRFGSLDAYVEWLATQPITAAPLERVPAMAETGTRTALQGQPREVVLKASRQAVRDAIFLVELVITLNASARETLRTEGLRFAALAWEMRALSAEATTPGTVARAARRTSAADRWALWRQGMALHLGELYAAAEALQKLERRYLDRHAVLFPDDAEDWERLVASAERLASMGDEQSSGWGQERDARPRARSNHWTDLDIDKVRAKARTAAAARAAVLLDTARAEALGLLGDTRAALRSPDGASRQHRPLLDAGSR